VRLLRLALLLALPLTLAAACASDDDRSAGLIHRLLLAAGTETSGELESFVGRLPEGLPVQPPQYPDADIILSSRQPAPLRQDQPATPEAELPRPMLYLIVLDSTDGRDAVFSFYEEALDDDPWQLDATFSSEQLDTLEFTYVEDADISGVVSIARGGEDDRTSILVSLQDAGALANEEPPFELGESLPVPRTFPKDVSVYGGAVITDTAFLREPGNESYLLVFLTQDNQNDVMEFYRGEFQDNGWTVLAGAPFGLEEQIDFRDENNDIQGQVLADRFSRDRAYTEVRLQVRVNPAREPPGSALDATPTLTAPPTLVPTPIATFP
jgi:hypothetical protein